MGGGSPILPKTPAPAPPPAATPPPAPPTDTEAQRAIGTENQRVRRRFSVSQTRVTGFPIGVNNDRPLGT
jgi:hypothetical protein